MVQGTLAIRRVCQRLWNTVGLLSTYALYCFCRCYLYRLARTWFSLTKHWSRFDPFFSQKLDAFRGSSVAVYGMLGLVSLMKFADE